MVIEKEKFEISAGFEIGLLGGDPEANSIMKQNLNALGFYNLKEFILGFQCIDYLRHQTVGLVVVSSSMEDMSWLTFCRLIRTDEKTLFAPISIFSKDVLELSSEDKDLLKNYQHIGLFGSLSDLKGISRSIKLAYMQQESQTSYTTNLNKTKEMYKQGLLARARDIYNQLLDFSGADLPARACLMYSLRHDEENYLEQLNYLLEADPKNYNFRFELMEYYLARNDQSKFRFFFSQLARDLATNCDSYWLEELGEICLSLKLTEFCDRISDIFTGDPNVAAWKPLLLKSRSRLSTGNIREAKILIAEAASYTKDNVPEILNVQGIIERRFDHQETALRLFKKASSLAPYDHRILFNISLCCMALENYENSLYYLDRAIQFCPAYKKAQQVREKVLRLCGDVAV